MPVLILKVTSFCNLNCSYCYMFNLGDHTYRDRAKHMLPETVDAIFNRVEEYLASRPKDSFHLCIHGGEPMLWKRSSFDAFFQRLSRHREKFPGTSVSIQSNFYLYDAKLLRRLREHHITCGVSLDGPEEANDTYRLTHRKDGTYRTVLGNVTEALRDGFGDVLSGFLCVINPSISPEQFLEWVRGLPLQPIKLLWPLEYNHSRTPWHACHRTEAEYRRNPLYGSWLRELFDRWWQLDDPAIHIVTFREMMAVAMGFRQHGDQIVNDSLEILVVDTGGEYMLHDYWRSVSDHFVVTGRTLADSSIDEAMNGHPLARAVLELEHHLPQACEACSVRDICGGGLLSGRAEAGSVDLRRRSVMCYDQFEIYSRVAEAVAPTRRAFAV